MSNNGFLNFPLAKAKMLDIKSFKELMARSSKKNKKTSTKKRAIRKE